MSKQIITEAIVAFKPVEKSGKLREDSVLITTDRGNSLWYPSKLWKDQYNKVSYEKQPVGTEYKSADGTTKKTTTEQLRVIGCSIGRESASEAAVAFFKATGVAPSFA